jgi:hypothetical protein
MTLTFFKNPKKSKSWLWLFSKSQKSQSHDFDFFQKTKKVKVMTLTFLEFWKKSKSWLWLFWNFEKSQVMTWLLDDLTWLFLKKMTFGASLSKCGKKHEWWRLVNWNEKVLSFYMNMFNNDKSHFLCSPLTCENSTHVLTITFILFSSNRK